MSKFFKPIASLLLGGVLLLLGQLGHATVTISLAAGSSCGGASSASYTPGSGTQLVSLCVTTTTEGLCGFDFNLQAANAGESGRFNVTAQSVAAGWLANQLSFTDPYPINNPPTLVDFGATAPALPAPVAGPVTLALATLTIAPQATATNASYVLSPPAGFAVYTASGADCLNLISTPEVASFTFNKAVVAAPTATIAVAPSSVPDNGTPLTYTVTLTPAPAVATPVSITSAVVGTMTGVTNNCTGTVTVSTSGTGTCTIAATNTVVGDGPATATVNVVAGAGYNVGSPATAAGTITNNDAPVPATITVAVSPASVAENSGTPLVYTFTASATSPTATALAFTPPAASSRYSSTCVSPITLPASATTVTCSVTPINNTLLDGSATATVTLLPSAGVYTVGSPATATGTITDDEIGLGVVASVGAITEGGTAVFTLSCTGVGSATANFSFSGSYSPLPANGSRLVTCGTPTLVNVPTLDDSLVNGDRTLTLTITSLSQPTAGVVIDPAKASASVAVLDNDRPTVIPTMSTLGLALLGLLLAASAGFSVRRRRF